MDVTIRHRLLTTVLFLGFCAYLFISVGFHLMLFREYAAGAHGASQLNLIPFAPLLNRLGLQWAESPMSLAMWLQLAAMIVPLGFTLFLWVDDCTSFRCIAVVAMCYSGVLCGTHYLLTAPVFDLDFITASVSGAFGGYALAVLCVTVLYGSRIRLMLDSPSKNTR